MESQDLPYANINKIKGEREKLKNCAVCVYVYKTGTFSLGVSGMLTTKEGKERMYLLFWHVRFESLVGRELIIWSMQSLMYSPVL